MTFSNRVKTAAILAFGALAASTAASAQRVSRG